MLVDRIQHPYEICKNLFYELNNTANNNNNIQDILKKFMASNIVLRQTDNQANSSSNSNSNINKKSISVWAKIPLSVTK